MAGMKALAVFLAALFLIVMMMIFTPHNNGENSQELTFNYISNGVTIVNDNVNCTQYIKAVDSIYPRLDKDGKIVKIDNCVSKNNKINADH